MTFVSRALHRPHFYLQPSNIFFSLDGQIKVGDFGLVTAMVENNSRLSTPSSDLPCPQYADDRHTARVGTHLYMSPEQVCCDYHMM
jgi:translation initiation factor 2-alpha kinase 3